MISTYISMRGDCLDYRDERAENDLVNLISGTSNQIVDRISILTRYHLCSYVRLN
jgi:hypothetical protein